MSLPSNAGTAAVQHDTRTLLSQFLWISGFALLTAAGARVEIPHYPVPYTLQTMVVLLGGAFLGARNGALSQILYLGLGAAGLPVFSGGGFGLLSILGPTGGYLLAFPVAAAVVGYLVQQRSGFLWSLLSMAAGLVLIFFSGTVQLYAVMFHDWTQAFTNGFLLFSWWDLIKLSGAAMIYSEVAKRYRQLPL